MNGEQKYNEALERARKEYKTHESFNGFRVMLLHIFPELEESDDERIRKKVLKMFNDMERDESILDEYGLDKLKTIAWLEKQESVEEIVERCKTSWYNEGKIQGKMEGLSDEEKYQQGWHDAIENQGEQKPTQETESFEAEHGKYYYCIKDYFCGGRKQASKGDVIQALRGLPIMGLKDASEYFLPINLIKCYRAWSEEDERIYQSIMDDTVQENQLDDRQTKWLSDIKYRYFPEPKQEWSEEDENMVKDIIASIDTLYYHGMVKWLKSLKDRIQSKQSNKPQGKTALEAIKEENVDNANKVEPKFKIGDWVVRKDGGFFFNDRKFAMITEIDGEKHWFDTGLISLKAEDMRLWTLEDAKDSDILYSKKHNLLWRYKNAKECYFCINLNYNSNNISIGDVMVIPNDVKPATKEQCDLLFAKMREKGYKWNNEKKEVIRRI